MNLFIYVDIFQSSKKKEEIISIFLSIIYPFELNI